MHRMDKVLRNIVGTAEVVFKIRDVSFKDSLETGKIRELFAINLVEAQHTCA